MRVQSGGDAAPGTGHLRLRSEHAPVFYTSPSRELDSHEHGRRAPFVCSPVCHVRRVCARVFPGCQGTYTLRQKCLEVIMLRNS